MGHTRNPSTWEEEAGESGVQDQSPVTEWPQGHPGAYLKKPRSD